MHRSNKVLLLSCKRVSKDVEIDSVVKRFGGSHGCRRLPPSYSREQTASYRRLFAESRPPDCHKKFLLTPQSANIAIFVKQHWILLKFSPDKVMHIFYTRVSGEPELLLI